MFILMYISELVANSTNKNPFTAVKMARPMFLDFNILQEEVTKRSIAVTGFKVATVFIFSHAYKQGSSIKPTYTTVATVVVKLQKGRREDYNPDTFNLSFINLPVKYDKPVKIKDGKLKDIKDLMQYILPDHKQFFIDLVAEQVLENAVEAVDDADSVDDDLLEYH